MENIWLELSPDDERQAAIGAELLTALGRLRPLILADWGWSEAIDLTDTAECGCYLERRLRAFTAWNRD